MQSLDGMNCKFDIVHNVCIGELRQLALNDYVVAKIP